MTKENKKSKGEEKKKVTKKMSFADVLNKYSEAGEVLMGEGLHCIGCPMAMMETIEEGCKAHSLDPDKIVKKVNKKLNKEKQDERLQ